MFLNDRIAVLDRYCLINWRVLLAGYTNKYITKHEIINYAVYYLQSHPEDNKTVYVLAGSDDSDDSEIIHLLEQLSTSSTDTEKECMEKWLLAELVILANETITPEEKIESLQLLYEKFDYPSYMSQCSKYGPSKYAIDNNFASQEELTTCPLEEMDKVISFLKNRFDM